MLFIVVVSVRVFVRPAVPSQICLREAYHPLALIGKCDAAVVLYCMTTKHVTYTDFRLSHSHVSIMAACLYACALDLVVVVVVVVVVVRFECKIDQLRLVSTG